jgi:hypothetical protein
MPRLLIPGLFQPTLQFRYTLFTNRLKGAMFYAYASTQPGFDNSPLELHHGNASFFVKGKTKWNPIQIKCYQFEGITFLDFWVYMQQHQVTETATDLYAETYKHDLRVSVVGPEEIPVGTWVLHGAFYENVDFGQMDRSSDAIAEVNATIRYDYAVYKPFF